jgi:chromosome segregation ATPase
MTDFPKQVELAIERQHSTVPTYRVVPVNVDSRHFMLKLEMLPIQHMQIEGLKSLQKQLSIANTDLQSKVASLETRNAELEQQLLSIKEDTFAVDACNEELYYENEALREENNELRAQLEKMSAQIEQRTAIDALKQSVASSCIDTELNLLYARGELTAVKEKIKLRVSQLQRAIADNYLPLKKNFDELQKSTASLRSELQQSQKKCLEANTTLNKLQAEHQKLDREAKKATALRIQVEGLKTDLFREAQAAKKQQDKLKVLFTKLDVQSIEETTTKFEQLTTELQHTKANLIEANRKVLVSSQTRIDVSAIDIQCAYCVLSVPNLFKQIFKVMCDLDHLLTTDRTVELPRMMRNEIALLYTALVDVYNTNEARMAAGGAAAGAPRL